MGNNKKKNLEVYDFMKVNDIPHKQFINEWYSHPETKRRLRNTLADTSSKPLNNLYSLGESYAQITGKNPFSPELNSQVDSLVNTSLNKINKAEGYYEFPDQLTKKYSGVNENTLGFTLKNHPKNYIINNKNKYINRSIPLHELTHISGLDVFNDSNFKNSEDLMLKHSKDLTDYKKYLINEPEVYPRVMEIRFNNKIKPGQIIKKGDIDTNHRSFQELMKIYNNENEVYDVLNTMANNTEVSNNLVQSANGGKINNMRKKKYFVGGNLDLMQSAQTKAVSGTKVNDALAIPINQSIPTEQIAGQAAGGISGNMGIFGGIANQGIQEIGSAIGLPGQSSQMVGGTAQAAMGALTGNPTDIAGGVGDILGAGIANAKTTFQNENADFGDKALATLGVINPVAGVISSFKNKDYARQQETKDMMNNVIKNNMMANGGLLPKEAYAVSNISHNGISRPPVNYQPMTGITVDSIPQQQPNGNLASVPQLSPDEIRRLNLVRSYNLGQAYDAELQDYYLNANPQMEHDIGRSIVNRPAANPGQVERGIQSDLDVIRQAEGRKRKPARLFAKGGKLNRFDGGFTHNDPSVQNSFEGIPIARGDNGEMHVVENGEASLPTSDGNQYIFSDQNKLTKNLAKQLNIANKYVGKTFAQIAKSYEDNTRKGDPLDEKTFDLNTRNLMAANEQAKQISEIGKVYKMAKGGKLSFNKYKVGGPLEEAPTAQVVQPRSEILATQDPALVDTMRSAGFYGAPGNIQHDPTFSETGKLDYLDGVDPENSDYGLFRGLTPQQYNAAYLPWVNKTYGTSDNVQNQEALLSNFDPNSELWQSYSPEEQSRRYRLLGELQAKGYDTSNPETVMKLVTDEKIGPATSLMNYSPYERMTVEDVPIDLPEPEVSYTPEGIPVDAKPSEKPSKPSRNLPNLWPELGLAGNLGAMAMLDPTYMTPSTMSTGYLRNRDLDVDNEKVASQLTNAISGITGSGVGGGGARSNILAAQINAGRTLSDWQRNIDATNVQNNLNTDTYNLNMQTSNDRFNTGNINQAKTMNTNIANQTNRELADTFASAVGNYSVAGNDRYYSNRGADFWGRATGYDPKTAQYLLAMQNTNKPVEETKASAYGGIIKTRKRKLK